jgi:hypothetical protein
MKIAKTDNAQYNIIKKNKEARDINENIYLIYFGYESELAYSFTQDYNEE